MVETDVEKQRGRERTKKKSLTRGDAIPNCTFAVWFAGVITCIIYCDFWLNGSGAFGVY